MPGLAPYGRSNDGSSRGEGIDRSTDGGRTWVFGALPGCLQLCGPVSLSMVDAENGFAVTSAPEGQRSLVFSTNDGGSTWAQFATMPSLGGVEVGGPIGQSRLLFTNESDGWALVGLPYGPSEPPQAPGGALYRTTDGGLSWSPVRDLPSGAQDTLPVFFGARDGVILTTWGASFDKNPTVYVTGDGGATWSGHAIPVFRGVAFSPGTVETRFAATGPMKWKVDVGSELYETDDGGRSWRSLVPVPRAGLGDAEAIEFRVVACTAWLSGSRPVAR